MRCVIMNIRIRVPIGMLRSRVGYGKSRAFVGVGLEVPTPPLKTTDRRHTTARPRRTYARPAMALKLPRRFCVMETTDVERFFQALTAMALMFSDEMGKDRMRQYWLLLQDKCTIEEWAYAAEQAMLRETFHKVPLPAQLMDYVREYRQTQQAWLAQAEREAQRTPTARELLQIRERLVDPEEIRRLITTALPDFPGVAGPEGERPRRVRWSPEELVYEPTVDPERAKAKLRRDFQRILDTEEDR